MDRKIGLGAGFINQLMGVLYGIHAPTNGITIVNVVNHGKPNAINHPPDDIFYGWYCINYPQDSPSAIHITMFFLESDFIGATLRFCWDIIYTHTTCWVVFLVP